MKDLPADIWAIVGEKLRREPPAPATKANWHDHFHQQDLVNMQRLSKAMYETVTPILYCSPIVQNLGLFLEGIHHPYESRPAPYHKMDLLSKVKSLTIIHASSPGTIKSPRLAIVDDGSAPVPNAVDSFTGDGLGICDLRSWERAISLWKSYHNTSNAQTTTATLFKKLKAMSFGVWDDGRWSIYRDRELVFRQYCCRVKIVMEGGLLSFTEREQSWGQFRAVAMTKADN